MASLVLGIASFLVCPLVTAVIGLILGRQAQEIIRASGGTLEGEGLAKAGVILSIVNLVACGLFIAMTIVMAISGGFAASSY